jgi:hypothetical protein
VQVWGAPDSVWCLGYQPIEQTALEKVLRLAGYNSPDYSVYQSHAWPTVGHAISVGHVSRTNGHQLAPDSSLCQVTNG